MMTRRTMILAGVGTLGLRAQAPYTLPPLGYAVDALEPFVDARTMEIHHSKHHQTYVNNLNAAVAGQPELARQPLEQLLRNWSTLPPAIRNNGGGHANHSLFWKILGKPKGPAKGKLAKAIAKSFGSQTAMEDKLKAAGLSVFGSGWVWVVPEGSDGLAIETSPNQDNPWMKGKTPVIGLDVWEHAYYLKYQNRRADYLGALLQVVDWDRVSETFEHAHG